MAGRSLWRDPATRQFVVLSALGFNSFFLTLSSLATWAVMGGLSRSAAGSVTGVMLGCTVLVQMAVPAIERRWGWPRVLAAGLIALGAPAPFYALSHGLGWLIALSVVRGAGFAVLTVIGGLLTTRIGGSARHTEVVGAYGIGIALPNLAAVPAGVALTLAGHFTVVAVLAASPVLALPAVSRLGRIARSDDTDHVGDRPPVVRASRAETTEAIRLSLKPALVLGVMTTAGGGLITFLPIARASGPWASLALFVFGLAAALSRWRAGSVPGWLGANLESAAVLLGAAGFVAISLTLDHRTAAANALLLLGAAVFGIGYGLAQNLTLVAAFARAGESHAIIASTVWNVAFDAGTAVGAYGVGVVAAGLGLPTTFIVCAGLVLVSLSLTRPDR